jgi:mRNA interferase RelE/StbE
VTYRVGWSVPALDRAAGFLRADPKGLSTLMGGIDDLAADPRPDASTVLGSDLLRRLRIGRYRVMYEVDDHAATVTVIHLGRVG